MIARFRILLPYTVFVPEGARLDPIKQTVASYQVTIHPPYQTKLLLQDLDLFSEKSPIDLLEDLEPVSDPTFFDQVLIGGRRGGPSTLIQIDFQADSFSRKRGQEPQRIDPGAEFIFAILNSFLSKIRSLTRSPYVKNVTPNESHFRITYLDDEGTLLPEDKELFRDFRCGNIEFNANHVSEAIWNQIQSLPDSYAPLPYEKLLLDAQSMMSEIGACIFLMHAALELLVEHALDILKEAMPASSREIWSVLTDKQRYRVAEQYKDLLPLVSGGRSLVKELPDHWNAFMKLCKARNGFAHEGKLVVEGNELYLDDVKEIFRKVKEIVDFVEELLPIEKRRQPFSGAKIDIGKKLADPNPGTNRNVTVRVDTI